MLFPAFSRLQDEKERMRLGYIRSQGAICLITFPIAAGFAVLAEEIVLLVIGEQWLPAVPLMQMIALTRILKTTHNLGPVALATANTKKLFHRDLRAFLIRWPLIIAGLYLGHRFGEGDPYWMLLGGMSGQLVTVAINAVLNIGCLAKSRPSLWLITGRFFGAPFWLLEGCTQAYISPDVLYQSSTTTSLRP